jgi:hypothetical protein
VKKLGVIGAGQMVRDSNRTRKAVIDSIRALELPLWLHRGLRCPFD